MRWIGVLMLGLAASAFAQVPVTREPRHRTVFENAQFRVLDVNIPPGDVTLDHSHENDIVTISMTDGTDTRTQAPGRPWSDVRPRRRLGHANFTEYTGKADSHRVENVGKGPYHLFAVENLKGGGWTSTPPLTAPGTTVALESRAFIVYDVRLPSERPQVSHVHAVPAIAVLIGGRAISEGPESKPAPNQPPIGLKQMDQPGQWVFVPRGESHHLVRLGTSDAQIVEIEIR